MTSEQEETEELPEDLTESSESEEIEAAPVAPLSIGLFQFVFITGCIILFVLISKLYLDQYIEIRKLEQRLDQERARALESELERQRLTRELEYLETLSGVERIAREKLRMVRPDEVIVVPVEE